MQFTPAAGSASGNRLAHKLVPDWCPQRQCLAALKDGNPRVSRGSGRVSDGTRTRDRLDHNQELYLLSYAHHVAALPGDVRNLAAGSGYPSVSRRVAPRLVVPAPCTVTSTVTPALRARDSFVRAVRETRMEMVFV